MPSAPMTGHVRAGATRDMRFKHVALEGVIGVGKITLARRLAAHWGARLVQEQPAENPYLAKYYALGPGRGNPLALQTQLSFLFQRIEQQRELSQPGMFEQGVVSDFLFAKDALFATLTLDDDDLALYRQVYRRLSGHVPQPDLVIWLQAPLDVLMARVRRRGLPMEQPITPAYLEGLDAAYHRFFQGYDGAPVLRVATERFHPAEHADHFERLIEAIERFEGRRAFVEAPQDGDQSVG